MMKTPDALKDAIRDAVGDELRSDCHDERQIAEIKVEEALEQCSKWFKYGELVSLEIDLDENTCKVKE